MKTNLLLVSTLLITSSILSHPLLNAQVECKVLIPALSGEYSGKCKNGFASGKGTAKGTDTYTGNFKNGLPHGKGRYEWSTGDVYEGSWEDGLRNGIGTFTFRINERDSVISGIWEKDEYMGPVPEKPKIINKYNIAGVSFYRKSEGARVEITIYQGGNILSNVQNFIMVGSSGSEYSQGSSVGFENILFPFTCKITFTNFNMLRTETFDCSLEFEIKEAGYWTVKINAM